MDDFNSSKLISSMDYKVLLKMGLFMALIFEIGGGAIPQG